MQNFLLDNKVISSLGIEEYEKFLGIPIGAIFLFIPVNSVKSDLTKIADSLLTPKLEVLRSDIIPSLSHVLSACLYDIENYIRNSLRYITSTPLITALPFFYAERNLGGLGIGKLSEESDI